MVQLLTSHNLYAKGNNITRLIMRSKLFKEMSLFLSSMYLLMANREDDSSSRLGAIEPMIIVLTA